MRQEVAPKAAFIMIKQFIWETIYRADGGRMMINSDHQREKQHSLTRRNTLTEFHNFIDASSDHDQYRSPFDFTWNITKSNVYERFLKNQFGRNYHMEKDDTTKNRLFKNWKDLRQLAASYPQFGSKVRSRLNPVTVTENQRRSLSSIGKSTYLLDLNRSSDSTIKIGVRSNHDHDYFRDYHVQAKLQNSIEDEREKNQKHHFEPNHEEHNKIDNHEDYFGNTQEIITFAEEGTQYRQYRILEFTPQNRRVVPPNQKLSIRSAQIHILIDKPNNYWIDKAKTTNFQNEEYVLNAKRKWRKHKIKIWIFELTAGINITEKGIDKAILFRASFEVNTKHLGWQKFDLTETIREWYGGHGGNEKLRLLIDCTGCGGRYSLHLFQTSKISDNSSENTININPNRPFLVLHTESARTRRVRRRAVDCGGALSGQCCKESFYVSFKALGWDDWIIAPRGYFANYCRGECTGTFRTPDTFQTFHAHFIEEYRKLGLLNGMRPCCAPIKFSSMSLIYYGDDGIIKRDLPKMVVDECGCP
ncbi:inhibin beta chain isoform X2 [Drosophila kikkawai]|uniref:Inhibin beta chain isoform X2 n=1 Tax=Drosophila kikkawai TaxID=30033 RepID=A0ABM3C7F7_DROKI|nr:inhibin beta chain [Drosophila kikkawai]